MQSLTGTFGAKGVSASARVERGEEVTLTLSGTYAATTRLERATSPAGLAWEPVSSDYSTANATVTFRYKPQADELLRVRCTAYTSGTVAYTLESVTLSEVSLGAGRVAGTNIRAIEGGVGVVRQTTLKLEARGMTVTDALAYASSKLYDFPEGRILILGCIASLQFAVTSTMASTINLNAAMDWSLGSAAATSVTLATTMVDLLPKVDKTLDAAINVDTSASTGALAAAAQFDGTTTPLDMYLNVSFPTGTDIDADGTMVVSGTITFTWINLGDY